MQEKPVQPPEGKLLKQAVAANGMSVRAAAAKVGLSDTRLRQILNGYIPLGAGQFAEVTAPAETLARIALELGVSPEALSKAGRTDAADLMTQWADRRSKLRGMAKESEADEIARIELQAWLDRGAGGDLPEEWYPPDVSLRLFSTVQLFRELAGRFSEQTAGIRAANAEIHRLNGYPGDGEPAMAWRITVEEQETPEYKAYYSSPAYRRSIEEIYRDNPDLRREREADAEFFRDEVDQKGGQSDAGDAEAQKTALGGKSAKPKSMQDYKNERLLREAQETDAAAYDGDDPDEE